VQVQGGISVVGDDLHLVAGLQRGDTLAREKPMFFGQAGDLE